MKNFGIIGIIGVKQTILWGLYLAKDNFDKKTKILKIFI
jgi:hypothetical protein